jgi:hypothetical protein
VARRVGFFGLETKLVEKPGAFGSDLPTIVIEHDMTALDQGIGECHAKPTRQMVVARPRQSQGLVAPRTGPVTRRAVHRNRHQRFDDPGHLGRGEAEIPMPTLLFDHQKLRFDQLAQMCAGGSRSGEPSGSSMSASTMRRCSAKSSARVRFINSVKV